MVQDQWLQQKMKFLLGYNLKIVIQWVRWTVGGVSLLGGWGGGEFGWCGEKGRDFLLSWGVISTILTSKAKKQCSVNIEHQVKSQLAWPDDVCVKSKKLK